ncbi:uncharacterized protein LACBIDRAFT_327825 [Laccaria bicolor S238N-H82]|uniref:Predicted protein n=1 Tax=Laccaria bicolor (strain S238N-H82 / ATCC MYA-4686) TaxID=486041 RepID=B0DCY4_LACBS|nr:uncharacterized protein LACBIDRAFT_327825 [Laccaria bicolor S238N-H82]EDR07515.1 predicted protein [Laccaria bicolor S238N-H82]|eukprot:XP_001881907.1 predicted protein [Laccaria bicolor S238N-H82]
MSMFTSKKFDAYIHVRPALEHVRPLLSPTTYKQTESRDTKDMFLKAHPHMAKFSQIYFDMHVLLKIEHMKLLRDSIEEESAFDLRRTMRNWYMNMAPCDRPKECEPWLPDFLGDKKFFGEDETVSTGFYFPGTPHRALDLYRTQLRSPNFTQKRSAPDTTIRPAPTKRMKPIPRIWISSSAAVKDNAEAAPNASTPSQKLKPRGKPLVLEAPSRKVDDLQYVKYAPEL